MTPHDHRAFVPGCYRCELGRDEAYSAAVRERDELQEAVTKAHALLTRTPWAMEDGAEAILVLEEFA